MGARRSNRGQKKGTEVGVPHLRKGVVPSPKKMRKRRAGGHAFSLPWVNAKSYISCLYGEAIQAANQAHSQKRKMKQTKQNPKISKFVCRSTSDLLSTAIKKKWSTICQSHHHHSTACTPMRFSWPTRPIMLALAPRPHPIP
jgi:hypothetical protein